MSDSTRPYSENFDTLIDVLTHLANCDYETRTAPKMAKDLGLDPANVRAVLNLFPGFFRRSKNPDQAGEHFYTVHLRYARRKVDGEKTTTESLTPAELGSLFDLVSKMIANENDLLHAVELDLQRLHPMSE